MSIPNQKKNAEESGSPATRREDNERDAKSSERPTKKEDTASLISGLRKGGPNDID